MELACIFVLSFVIAVLTYDLIKQEGKIKRLTEKYNICFTERAEVSDALQSQRERYAVLSGTIQGLAKSYPYYGPKPLTESTLSTTGKGPLWDLSQIRHKLEANQEEIDSIRGLLASCTNLCLKVGTFDQGMTIEGNIDKVAEQWETYRLNSEKQKKPSRGQRLQADIESLLAALKEHEDQYTAENYTSSGTKLMTLPELSAMVTDQLKGAGEVTSRFLVKYGRDGEYCKPFVTLADYICCLSIEWKDCRKSLDECKSNLEASRKLADCYLLSRNQARDDIQSMKAFLVAVGAIESQEQLDSLCFTRGIPAPEEIRAAQTFEDFYKLAQDRGLIASIELSTAATPPSGQLNPPKPRRTRGRK